jgi:hypothetical protein
MRVHWQPLRRCVCILLFAGIGAGFLASQTTESIQASPDFLLAVDAPILFLTAGGPAQSITLTASALNGFSGTISVKISDLPIGVTASPDTFSLSPGAPRKISLQAASSGVGGATIFFTATSRLITHTVSLPAYVKIDVVTQHYDVERTGLNPNEADLTHDTVNVAQFGLLRTLPVDGVVDAQPLFLSNVTVRGKVHNVVYVVTEHDSVYAFDGGTGGRLWKVSVLGSGETPSVFPLCPFISPEIGITSTPVIDRKIGPNGALFLVSMSQDAGGRHHQRLHAIDAATGEELKGSPTEVGATYPGTGVESAGGVAVFEPANYAERTGLLLLNGTIYMAWTSHCDQGTYGGWLMGYNETTLTQTSALDVTPNGKQGAIWMSGAALAADSDGYIYFLDGNGTFDSKLTDAGFPVNDDYGNGFIKVSTANGKLAVADYFEMSQTENESALDKDLGSGGAMVLPDVTDSAGIVHHLAVGAGKDAEIYVVNRDSMGKFSPNDDSGVYEEIDGAIKAVFSKPAFYDNKVYYAGAGDKIKAFPISEGKLATSPIATTANVFGFPGATPTISSNGLRNGVVWAVERGTPAILHAYRADTLVELYNSSQAAGGRDQFGPSNRFVVPMVVNGKVYVATPTGVAVFGLLPESQ